MKVYAEPEIKILAFKMKDILTSSEIVDEGEGGENDFPII